MAIDWQSDIARAIARRLREELLAWLTVVRADGTPLPTPVWFYWNDANPETVLFYSEPRTAKLKAIAANPWAALNLETGGYGRPVTVLYGNLRPAPDVPAPTWRSGFGRKYHAMCINRFGSVEAYGRRFSVPLRLQVTGLRAWGLELV